MSIKQNGGVFGRNPTFNDVTIEGQLTFDGDIDINSDLKVDGDLDVTGTAIVNKLGINAPTPASALDVVGANKDAIRIRSTVASNQYYQVGRNQSTGLLELKGSEATYNGYLFKGPSSDLMEITAAGTATMNGLVVDGNSAGNTGIANCDVQITRNRVSSIGLRALSNGEVIRFVHTATDVGSIDITTSATSYNTSSDYRLKEDVQPMSGATDRLKELKPVNFAWKADGSRVDGFLAHEAQEVVPESVTGSKDAMQTEEYEVTPAVTDEEGNVTTEAVMGEREVPDYQGIDQSKLVPLLVATIQELEARITALEA